MRCALRAERPAPPASEMMLQPAAQMLGLLPRMPADPGR
jgi:hypothetical protein